MICFTICWKSVCFLSIQVWWVSFRALRWIAIDWNRIYFSRQWQRNVILKVGFLEKKKWVFCFCFAAELVRDLWTDFCPQWAVACHPGKGPPASASQSPLCCAPPNGPSTQLAAHPGTMSTALSPKTPLSLVGLDYVSMSKWNFFLSNGLCLLSISH